MAAQKLKDEVKDDDDDDDDEEEEEEEEEEEGTDAPDNSMEL